MEWREPFRELLKSELDRRKASNPQYSMRSFGRDIGMSIGGLSNFLRGNLEISAERAASILLGFNLKIQERDYYLGLMGHPIQRQTVKISDEHADMFGNWLYFAVLHFFDLDAQITPLEIATRLSVGEDAVQKILDLLLEKKFLQRLPSGEIVKPEIHWTVGDEPAAKTGEIIRQYHRASLQTAARALDAVPPEKRQISTTVFCGSESQVENARSEILALHQRLSSIMEGTHPRTDVYHLTVALYPLNFREKTQ